MEWNPQMIFVGDLQIWAIASYYINEQLKGEIMEEYEEKEKSIDLPIRKEARNPDAVIDGWLKLINHKGVGKKIMKLRKVYYERMQMLAMGLGH